MKISIVVPWFGEHCRGGAEKLSRIVYDIFVELGHDVEMVSTTVKSFDSNWSNPFYREGNSVEGDVRIRRFDPVLRNTNLFDEVNARLLKGYTLTPAEERTFLHQNVNSLALNRYVAQGDRDLYVYMPYMFGPTLFGLLHNSGKNLLIPLLHDEGYAYLTVVSRSLSLADRVIFMSDAERELFEKLYGIKGKHSVIPIPIESAKTIHQRVKVPFQQYILYAGRKDKGKNVDFVFDVMRGLQRADIGCILIGGGAVDVPHEVANRILDLGYVTEEQKAYLMENALCLLNPSLYESFSMSSVEANLNGTPVIVNSLCNVLVDYVRNSGGGVSVTCPSEACAYIESWGGDKTTPRIIGKTGKEFVECYMARDVVMKAYENFLTGNAMPEGGVPIHESSPSLT